MYPVDLTDPYLTSNVPFTLIICSLIHSVNILIELSEKKKKNHHLDSDIRRRFAHVHQQNLFFRISKENRQNVYFGSKS